MPIKIDNLKNSKVIFLSGKHNINVQNFNEDISTPKANIDTKDIQFEMPKVQINGGNFRYCKPKEVFRGQKHEFKVQDHKNEKFGFNANINTDNLHYLIQTPTANTTTNDANVDFTFQSKFK